MKNLASIVLEDKNLKSILNSLKENESPALVLGTSQTASVNIAAALRLETKKPILIICADESAADSFKLDLDLYLGEKAMRINARELCLYKIAGFSHEYEQERIKTLYNLLEDDCPILIGTISGLLQRTMPKEVILENSFSIEIGESYNLEEIIKRLINSGYRQSEQVEGKGQFSRRGGILDFFSPCYENPVRCEFWGDEIDSMGFFDISSQRRIESIDKTTILPAREIIPKLGDFDKLTKNLSSLIKSAERGKNPTLVENLREDLELLKENGDLISSDAYISLIYPEFSTVFDYLMKDTLVFFHKPSRIREQIGAFMKQHLEDIKILVESGKISGKIANFFLPYEEMDKKLKSHFIVFSDNFASGKYLIDPKSIINMQVKQLPNYGGNKETALVDVKHYISQKYRTVVLAQDKRRGEILAEFFLANGVSTALDINLTKIPEKGCCTICVGSLSSGYEYPNCDLVVISDAQILATGFKKSKKKKFSKDRQGIESYSDLSVGDLVVHEVHGIGRFAGISKMQVDGASKDYIKICYAGSDSLYVPATALDLVAKYIGAAEDKQIKLSKMGGTEWVKTKQRAKKAAKDLAKGLIALYAQRQMLQGHAFAKDSDWQKQFEENFQYDETDDQLRSIVEIKEDMESTLPMDRLLCGDVGYGKTEVALRAIMKCILDGKQAAILVPTTVLAQQHYNTAHERFHGFPIGIELLNRYRTPAQIRQSIINIKTGKADLIIGTHRLIQKDVQFKDLGLLIIDEEQRFGVSHKEQLKEIAKNVDTLTLSATPIPRTLNMALSGLRDMSTLEEPPTNRLAVQTFVVEHDFVLLAEAIRKEILRGGQVFYVHNRIDTIELTAGKLRKLLENVNIGIAHGRMDSETISDVMEKMINGEIDVLVCTTIIETGIDIPNANTLIIEDADKFGLSSLHQLRGRVGRSNRRASAYLTFKAGKTISEVAEKRLSAIREFAEFNSGFKIAMRDLEIRGAGNMLGAEQSGHLIDVGYDLYLKLLEEAVLEEKGEKPKVKTECSADLSISANIPEKYVKSQEQRMDLYRRIALIRDEEQADDLIDEMIDRFGDLPESVNALIKVSILRAFAQKAEIAEISQKGGYLRFVFLEFNLEKYTKLYESPEYKGRIKVEKGNKPCISIKLNGKKKILDAASDFVRDYSE